MNCFNRSVLKEEPDCIKTKREIQAQIYEETKGMTNEQLLAYFHIPKEKSIFKDIRND